MVDASEHKQSVESSNLQIEHLAVQDELPRGYFRSPLFLGSMTAVGFGTACGIGGFAIVAPILGIINADLGPDPDIIWVALVYTLIIAIGMPLVGRVTDVFGRRYTFIGGTTLSLVGSVVCSRAQTINVLIGGMTLIGLGTSTQAGFFYVSAELVPAKYRFTTNATMYVFSLPLNAFGPAISYSAVLHTQQGWRTGFYVLVGLNFVTLLCWVLFYRPPTFQMKHKNEKKRTYIRNFDYLGMVLFAGGLLIFLLGLNWGGTAYAWDSAYVLGTLVVGAVAVVAFILWEVFVPLKEPLIPIRLIASPSWTASCILSGIGASLYYALSIVWPSMIAVLYSTGDIMQDGWIACLTGALWTLGQCFSGYIAKDLGWVKTQMITTITLSGIFLGCMATCDVDTKTQACVLLSFATFFAAYVEGLSITTTTLTLPDQQQMGAGGGFGGAIRFTISAIAQSVYSVVLSNSVKDRVAEKVPAALQAGGLPASSIAEFITALSTGGSMDDIPGITASIIQVGTAAYKSANAGAYRMVFYTTIPFSVVGIIAACLLPNIDNLMTNEVAAAIHHKKDEHMLALTGGFVAKERPKEDA